MAATDSIALFTEGTFEEQVCLIALDLLTVAISYWMNRRFKSS